MLMPIFLTTVHLCTAVATADTATVVPGRDVTRDYFGDIFRMRDCKDGVVSRSTCDRGGTRLALEIPGRPCFCQCAPSHFSYRDDREQCVKEIRECYMSVFFRPYAVEAIPLVFLPTSGQLVHPDAHLSLAGRRRPPGSELPRCKATVSQFMTPEGWRTITREKGGPIFSLFQDGNKTFLQSDKIVHVEVIESIYTEMPKITGHLYVISMEEFLGNTQDRHTLQQRLVLIRMFCKIPNYTPFETCVAVRVGWVPGAEPLAAGEDHSKSNMIVVGLSLGVLGMVYVLAVLIYLKLRRRVLLKASGAANGKPDLASEEQGNSQLCMDPAKRLELYHTHSLGRQKISSEMRDGLRCWTPLSLNETYNRNWTDGPGQMGCEFNVQEFQLRPEHFEPAILASPPQPVAEYLERLQISMTYARHRLRVSSRYQPTLLGIPEEDCSKERCPEDEDTKVIRTTPDGVSSSSNESSIENGSTSTSALINTQDNPKIPPRKPRRKSVSSESSCCRESSISEAEEEKNQIKSAMDTLNDTLEAIEYDIFQQDALDSDAQSNAALDESLAMNVVEEADAKCEQLTSPFATADEESDGKEFDTSTCSSLSVVTVLSKGPKLPPINRIDFNKNKHASQLHSFVKKPDSKNLALNAGRNESFKISNLEERQKTPTSTELECKESSEQDLKEKSQEKKLIESITELLQENIEDDAMFTAERTPSDGAETTSFASLDSEIMNVSGTSTCGSKPSISDFSSDTSTVTDMTLDSLESQSEKAPPLSMSSLLEMWLNKLAEGSLRGKESRRKSKKKEGKGSWDHICRKKHRRSKKTREPCPVHDTEDHSVLVEKLAHYDSETTPSYDVSSYFQALKRDVLREHLMSGWLSQNRDRAHRMPLVTGDDDSLPEPSDSGFRSSPNNSPSASDTSGSKIDGPLRTSSPKVTDDMISTIMAQPITPLTIEVQAEVELK